MANDYEVVELPMNKVYCDTEFNCRGVIEPFTVVELANDIAKNGLQTPISVQPFIHADKEYRILAGHRRFMAYQVNNAATIPAFIKDIKDDLDARDYNLKENIFRQDLTLLQEAKALTAYIKRGLTDKNIADRLNRSPGWVQPRRQLLDLPEDIQKEADKGVINWQHIKALFAKRHNPEKMYEIFRSIKEAKARGEKVVTVKEEKDILSITKLKRPTQQELYQLLDMTAAMITHKTQQENFGCRVLAFCAGTISEAEFYGALRRECQRLGIEFTPPKEIKDILEIP